MADKTGKISAEQDGAQS